jgi:hypothetical protein
VRRPPDATNSRCRSDPERVVSPTSIEVDFAGCPPSPAVRASTLFSPQAEHIMHEPCAAAARPWVSGPEFRLRRRAGVGDVVGAVAPSREGDAAYFRCILRSATCWESPGALRMIGTVPSVTQTEEPSTTLLTAAMSLFLQRGCRSGGRSSLWRVSVKRPASGL